MKYGISHRLGWLVLGMWLLGTTHAGGQEEPPQLTHPEAPGQQASSSDRLRPVDAEALMEQANQRYQEGDFPGAVAAYEAILEAGYEGGDHYYNLGNAYFKTGDLGRSILSYERALDLKPRDPDIRANLELTRSLTADVIEPLPRFWVLSAISWWVNLLPLGWLILTVVFTYFLGASGLCIRILYGRQGWARSGTWLLAGSGFALLIFGSTLLAREGWLGGADWGVILAEEVPVQSAPSPDDDLTLFHVHEGTKVRLDQRTDSWSEIVLEDGKVGWVPSGVFEAI